MIIKELTSPVLGSISKNLNAILVFKMHQNTCFKQMFIDANITKINTTFWHFKCPKCLLKLVLRIWYLSFMKLTPSQNWAIALPIFYFYFIFQFFIGLAHRRFFQKIFTKKYIWNHHCTWVLKSQMDGIQMVTDCTMVIKIIGFLLTFKYLNKENTFFNWVSEDVDWFIF